MSDRIPCVNPRCRRTAPAEKYEPGTRITCGKCFHNLPQSWRARYRQLWRRRRFIERRWRKRIARGDVAPGQPAPTAAVDEALNNLCDDFVRYFTAPEKPAGLENFLQEVGLA